MRGAEVLGRAPSFAERAGHELGTVAGVAAMAALSGLAAANFGH